MRSNVSNSDFSEWNKIISNHSSQVNARFHSPTGVVHFTGLELAQYFDFPPTVLTKAREIVVKLEEEAKEVDEAASNQQKRDNANHRLKYFLYVEQHCS